MLDANFGNGEWCLHVRIGAVGSKDQMGTPASHGTGNSDVLLNFTVQASNTAPWAPDVPATPWYSVQIMPGDAWDTKEGLGIFWARFFPAVEGSQQHVVQIIQTGYPAPNGSKEGTLRHYNGRCVQESPTIFFGHVSSNNSYQDLSFTLTRGKCPPPQPE